MLSEMNLTSMVGGWRDDDGDGGGIAPSVATRYFRARPDSFERAASVPSTTDWFALPPVPPFEGESGEVGDAPPP